MRARSAGVGQKQPDSVHSLPIFASTPYPSGPLERWPSGRRRSPAKGVWVKSPSRVRIPLSPPVSLVNQAPAGAFFLHPTIYPQKDRRCYGACMVDANVSVHPDRHSRSHRTPGVRCNKPALVGALCRDPRPEPGTRRESLYPPQMFSATVGYACRLALSGRCEWMYRGLVWGSLVAAAVVGLLFNAVLGWVSALGLKHLQRCLASVEDELRRLRPSDDPIGPRASPATTRPEPGIGDRGADVTHSGATEADPAKWGRGRTASLPSASAGSGGAPARRPSPDSVLLLSLP